MYQRHGDPALTFDFSVIKRLVSLIATNATLDAEREAAMKQAQSASRAAETLMDSADAGKKTDQGPILRNSISDIFSFSYVGQIYTQK
jgi:hypothetical protein